MNRFRAVRVESAPRGPTLADREDHVQEKSEKSGKVTLAGMMGGVPEELFSTALAAALKSIEDPNAPEKAKRVITLRFVVERLGDRSVTVSVDCATKFPAPSPLKTVMAFGMHEGSLAAVENAPQIDAFNPTPALQAVNGGADAGR